MRITIIGMGPGGEEWLPLAAQNALRQASLCVGAQRLLNSLPLNCYARKVAAIKPEEIIALLAAHEGHGDACVLFSGDSGFYSGAKRLLPLLSGYEVRLLPGISSMQLLAARLARPWQDWQLASAHGRACNVVTLVRDNDTVFFLTGGQQTAQQICVELAKAGLGACRAVIGECLGYAAERLHNGTVAELAEGAYDDLAVLLVDNPAPCYLRSCGFADSDFLRGDIPMTKAEVRAVALSKLRLCACDTVFDVGAGTGSVAVEAALVARQGQVYAIEREAEGCRLIAANAQRFGVANLQVVAGCAPQAFAGLPVPDAAFIGGSGGQLPQILRYLLQLNPRIRLVISAISLQTLSAATAALAELPFSQPEIVQVAISRAEAAGGHQLLKAQNPIFLLSGEGCYD